MNKKITQILAGVITLLLVAALAFWAGRTTLKPPERITQTGAETMTVTVTEQNIGRTLTLSTTVERAAQPVAVNQLNGTSPPLPQTENSTPATPSTPSEIPR